MSYKERRPAIPTITTVAEYAGETSVLVSATQLDTRYSRTDATRIVAEWCQFFIEPTPLLELEFVSRTPKRLFESLRGQTQLRVLRIKWGDYEDLTALAGLTDLIDLSLGGASSLRSVAAIADLPRVEKLKIESLRHVRDLSPLGRMHTVTDLDIGGDWHSPRIAHIDSIAFLADMPQLRSVWIHTMIVDDLDYSPLLRLPNLTMLHVMKARGMTPTWDDLAAAIPALS